MSRRLAPNGGRSIFALLACALLVLAAVGAADAAVGPSVSTGSATSVTATSATLNGTVDPNGSATNWHVDYGLTTQYGQTTPNANAGTGTSNLSVSAQVANLQPGKTYHFRIVATSAGGTSSGVDGTFATPALGSSPPSATTSAASAVTGSSATLNGTVNPNGAETTWSFEYGTTTTYTTTTPAKNAGSGTKPAKASVAIKGLSAGTTYHFRLVAKNASGTTDGADQTFTTSGPPAVQTGSAQTVAATSAVLTGTVNPLGHGTNWHFEYGPTIAYGSATPNKNAGGGSTAVNVTAPITKLTPGTTYHFRIVATSNAGTSAGADATFTTVSPVTVTASARTVVYGGSVRLSGVVAGGKPGVTVTLFVRRYPSTSYVAGTTVLTGAGGAWSLSVRPKILTSYEASANGSTSAAVAVGLRPRISLSVHGRTVSAKVTAARSFARRYVVLQRFGGGSWHAVARKALNRHSAATFPTRLLSSGMSTIRVTISTNQAGVGYLGGASPKRIVRR